MSDDEAEDLRRYERAITPLRDAYMGQSCISLDSISFAIGEDEHRDADDSTYGTMDTDEKNAKAEKQRQERQRKCYSITVCFALFTASAGGLAVAGLVLARQGMIPQNGWKSSMLAFPAGLESAQVTLPADYGNFWNLDEEAPLGTSIPVLWDIPGDGDVYQHVMSKCVGLTAAGGALGDKRQTDVGVSQPLEIFENNAGRYVNVNPGSMKGIRRASEMKLSESGMADVVYAPLIYETAAIFPDDHKGRMFALLHHPVHRVAGIFHLTRTMYPEQHQGLSLVQWLQTDLGDNNDNWLTRELAGGHEGVLDEEHFQVAKEVLRTKCLIGLTTEVEASLDMMLDYFGWGIHANNTGCVQEVLETRELDRLYFDLVEENSAEWNYTVSKNEYDVRLHEYAELLFKEQQQWRIASRAMGSSVMSSSAYPRAGVALGITAAAIGWTALEL